jgi:nucleoside-diphosphate-sugar epimerase
MRSNSFISVVGGSGFIGTRLCRLIDELGGRFEIIDRRASGTFPNLCKKADVRDIQSLRDTIQGDILINLAAEHRDDVSPKSLYDEVNVDGAKNLCQVAEEKGIRKIVFTSSVAVYGFAPINTDETGTINYFNDYGRTKYLAEEVFREWYRRDPENRSLIILRPTVVFGEQNRGNVYNLLSQIASGKFLMIGDGKNVKSMAYVGNIAKCLDFLATELEGYHLYNYVDKPDMNMNQLVSTVYDQLGKGAAIKFRVPYAFGMFAGYFFDAFAKVTGKKLSVSSIRVKKFCSNTAFTTSISKVGFHAPESLETGLRRTIQHEFLEQHQKEVFFSE